MVGAGEFVTTTVVVGTNVAVGTNVGSIVNVGTYDGGDVIDGLMVGGTGDDEAGDVVGSPGSGSTTTTVGDGVGFFDGRLVFGFYVYRDFR